MGVFDNHFAIAPSDGGTQKTGNFDVFFLRKQMRNLHGITFDKIQRVVLDDFFVKEGFEFGWIHNLKTEN